jgi:hypothetical protein
MTGCRAPHVDVPKDITTSSDQDWLVPANSLEERARTRVQQRPAPTTDATALPAYQLPGAGAAYRFPRTNLVKRVLETPTGRYLAEVARHQLGAELDPSNPLPDRRMILMPAYDGDRLSFIFRVYW